MADNSTRYTRRIWWLLLKFIILSNQIILFLPSYMSPLKDHKQHLNTKHRIKMIQLVIDILGFGEICYEELERKGTSYTFDTIQSLISKNQDAEFYFVIGTDQYNQLEQWHNINQLKEIITFVIVNRDTSHQIVDPSMISIDIPRIDISSTMIRNRVQNNKTSKYSFHQM